MAGATRDSHAVNGYDDCTLCSHDARHFAGRGELIGAPTAGHTLPDHGYPEYGYTTNSQYHAHSQQSSINGNTAFNNAYYGRTQMPNQHMTMNAPSLPVHGYAHTRMVPATDSSARPQQPSHYVYPHQEGHYAPFPVHEEIKDPPSYAYTSVPLPQPAAISPLGSSRPSISPYESLRRLPSIADPLSQSAPQSVRVRCRWNACTIDLDDISAAGIKRHLRDFHKEHAVEEYKSQRGVCLWADGTPCMRDLDRASFGKHIASVHLKSTAAECRYCHNVIGRPDSLKRHMRDHCPYRPSSC
ncbi:hypothetical protein IEO21_02181 [Rhodonia placenta]|uniref:C2H2-type domain-containing protein n=1 Tax=Rhodonia placenta TaxID=104341 RepID=A0A8H7P875_9APHY|nr:hypothetical protein IEO21_02181 [Postia placenta]